MITEHIWYHLTIKVEYNLLYKKHIFSFDTWNVCIIIIRSYILYSCMQELGITSIVSSLLNSMIWSKFLQSFLTIEVLSFIILSTAVVTFHVTLIERRVNFWMKWVEHVYHQWVTCCFQSLVLVSQKCVQILDAMQFQQGYSRQFFIWCNHSNSFRTQTRFKPKNEVSRFPPYHIFTTSGRVYCSRRLQYTTLLFSALNSIFFI